MYSFDAIFGIEVHEIVKILLSDGKWYIIQPKSIECHPYDDGIIVSFATKEEKFSLPLKEIKAVTYGR